MQVAAPADFVPLWSSQVLTGGGGEATGQSLKAATRRELLRREEGFGLLPLTDRQDAFMGYGFLLQAEGWFLARHQAREFTQRESLLQLDGHRGFSSRL